jgi:hypothetical protein
MNSKWFVVQNKFVRFRNKIWFIPCISIWYDSDYFLETGVTSPALGFQISWLSWAYGFIIQKGY